MNALTQPQRYLQAAQGLDATAFVSTPDYVSQYTQLPAHWEYSIDPATGVSRADYFGELFLNGGSVIAGATSGSGPFVLQNGATLTAPVINAGTINGGTLSGTVTNAGTINGGTLGGTVINAGTISGGVLAAPNIVGVTNGSNAPAGDVGEVVTNSAQPAGPASGAPINITSVTLTAGDWDVFASAGAGTTGQTLLTGFQAGLSLVSATLPTGPWNQSSYSCVTAVCAGVAIPPPPLRVNVTTTQTVWLVIQATYSSTPSNWSSYGMIYARRVR